MSENAKNKRDEARAEIRKLGDDLIRENDRTTEMPYAIIYMVGLLSLMGGTLNILNGGIDLTNGITILFGGFTTYKWHQSDKRKKSLRAKISLLEKPR